jgi:hypothetical protein
MLVMKPIDEELLLLTVALGRLAIDCERAHHDLPVARLIDLGARSGLL